MIIGKTRWYAWWKANVATKMKRRRIMRGLSRVDLPEKGQLRVLEVGCANGKDVLQFLDDPARYELYGVDLNDQKDLPPEINFSRADAEHLPFPDKHFDLVISVGLLEHIEPMEKLCAVIKEMDRVGKRQLHIVPSVTTLLEPHCGKLRFSHGLHKHLFGDQTYPLHLNFFTEHTWTTFEGFFDCQVDRMYYLPPLIKNTVIWK